MYLFFPLLLLWRSNNSMGDGKVALYKWLCGIHPRSHQLLFVPAVLTAFSAPVLLLFTTASQFGRAAFKEEPS
jgi:hypothetical protein